MKNFKDFKEEFQFAIFKGKGRYEKMKENIREENENEIIKNYVKNKNI